MKKNENNISGNPGAASSLKYILPEGSVSGMGEIISDMKSLADIIETGYGRYLHGLFLKEWEIEKRNDLLVKFEDEHSDSLVLLIQNESQKMQLNELNEKLNALFVMHQKDMTMAANVQRNLFVTDPPAVNNYDISYHYQPCASVSGDFFDFYIDRDQNKLKGMVLADVSGHGIASGLLTVLAKPIFFREFTDNPLLAVNQLLERINLKLIAQMEASENYLTGALLRFSGSTIEYTNSAHPDIIHYDSLKGTASSVRPIAGDIQGGVLGIESVAVPFNLLEFRVSSGDLIVIYSDCLTESVNSQGKEFGEEGITGVLTRCGLLSAAGVRDSLLESFYEFTGTKQLKDDLSIIVLKCL